jgi:hypothetical protein
MSIPAHSFVELQLTGSLGGQFRETARHTTGPLLGGSWRVTVHEPRPQQVSNGNAWVPRYLPTAPAAAGAVGRIVDVDAGLLLRVTWSRHQVHHAAIVDYVAGLSFTIHGGDPTVEVAANFDPSQIIASPNDFVLCGATIEAAHQGAMSNWPPTRSKDTGVIAHVAAGPITDNVAIRIPPYARAFRWHAYQVGAAATAISFRQFDVLTAGAQARSLVRATTDVSSWPNAGAVPIVGTSQWLRVQNDDAAQDVALWVEFLLDLGG